MSGEGTIAMSVNATRPKSLATIAALAQLPLDEAELIFSVVADGIISEKDAILSIQSQSMQIQGAV